MTQNILIFTFAHNSAPLFVDNNYVDIVDVNIFYDLLLIQRLIKKSEY